MTITSEMRALFGDATWRQRMLMATILGAFISLSTATCSWAGAIAGKLTPVKQTVTIKRVIRNEIVTIPVAPRSEYPPLKNPKEACSGAPVVVENINVAGSQRERAGSKKVWSYLSVRPAGDDYRVICSVAGDYSPNLRVGHLVRLYSGEVAA